MFLILSGLKVQITPIPIENIIPEMVYIVFMKALSGLTLNTDDKKIEIKITIQLISSFFFIFDF